MHLSQVQNGLRIKHCCTSEKQQKRTEHLKIMTLSGNRMSVELQLQPRPPVPGSESPPDAFQEGNLLGNIKGGQGLQRHLDDPCKILQPLIQAVPLKSAMAPSPKATSESGSLRGFEPEGSADVTPPFRFGNKQSKAEKVNALIN